MLFELNDIKSFSKVLKTTSNILDEVAIILDEDGVRLSVLDRPHICFVNAEWSNTYFDTYMVSKPLKINVDLDELVKVLGRGKVNDTMSVDVIGADLVIVFNGESKRTFKIRLLDDTVENPSLPDMSFDTEIEFVFDDFIDCLKDTKVFNDQKIKFSNIGDKLNFYADGNYGEYNGALLLTETNNVESVAVYSTSYLDYFAPLNSMCDLLKFQYGTDTPCKVIIDDDNGCTVSFLIAPRIEE